MTDTISYIYRGVINKNKGRGHKRRSKFIPSPDLIELEGNLLLNIKTGDVWLLRED